MRPGKIYTLTNPVGNILFYVGSTRVELHRRLSVHVWGARNRPLCSATRYISRLTLKPFIEELERFEAIDDDGLRMAELFWLRQLKSWGFPLVNDQRPFNDNEVTSKEIDKADLEFLKSKMKYMQLVREETGMTIQLSLLTNAIKVGRCHKVTFFKIHSIIEQLRKYDYSRLQIRGKAIMYLLTEDEKKNLKAIMNRGSKNINREYGLHRATLYRALNDGIIRQDKYKYLQDLILQGTPPRP